MKQDTPAVHTFYPSDVQKEAIFYGAKPLVVFAGPGSGKTAVLTYRARALLRSGEVSARGLYLVTFTRAAAKEMQERLSLLIEPSLMTFITVSTFHSLYLKILLKYKGHVPSIISSETQWKLASSILVDSGVSSNSDTIKEFLTHVTWCKSNRILPHQFPVKSDTHIQFQAHYEAYEKKKTESLSWDYDDILLECYQLLIQNPDLVKHYCQLIEYMMIDEFQDTNRVQFDILRLLTPKGNLTVVGDDDQSIYGFRGSNADYLLEFKSFYPDAKQLILQNNYRSSKSIQKVSHVLIEHNLVRQNKKADEFESLMEQESIPQFYFPCDELEESFEVANLVQKVAQHETVGILYRTHQQSALIVEELIFQNLLFHVIDQAEMIYNKWQFTPILNLIHLSVITDPHKKRALVATLTTGSPAFMPIDVVLGYASWMREKSPKEVLKRLINDPHLLQYLLIKSQKLRTSVNVLLEPLLWVKRLSSRFQTISEWLTYVFQFNQRFDQNNTKHSKLFLSTFHGAKGLEFDTVILIGCVEGVVPHPKSLNSLQVSKAIEEERRLFYVGVTRAKTNLHLLIPKSYKGNTVEPSLFIEEIKESNINQQNLVKKQGQSS